MRATARIHHAARVGAAVQTGRTIAATAVLVVSATVSLGGLPTPGAAQDADDAVHDDREVPAGPNVIEAMDRDDAHWLVGTTLDVTASSVNSLEDELLWGVSVTHRFDAWGIGFKLAADPVELGRTLESEREHTIDKHRALFELHARYTFDTFGLTWSYGVGAQVEARIARHFGLFYLTPLELGTVVYRGGSNYLQLFAGMRVLAIGELINHFLIDPNGYDSDSARDGLRQEQDHRAEAFIGIAFTRRVD